MPDLMERMYCSEQIHIPPTFPYIMKLYCKAAIRTQPYDLLKWSAAYFRALANGETPPAKERIEYPPYDTPTGLTPGYIKVLVKQLGKDPNTTVSAQTLFIKWNNVCLQEEVLIKLLALMGAKTNFNWLQFIAVAAGSISNTLTQTMILLCELLTDEPEGGMATIPFQIFMDLYTYLALMNCGPLTEEEIEEMEAIEVDEDAVFIAEKMRNGEYGGEIEGESVAEVCVGEGDQYFEKSSTDESTLKPEESSAVSVVESQPEQLEQPEQEMMGEDGMVIEQAPEGKEEEIVADKKGSEATVSEKISESSTSVAEVQKFDDAISDSDVKSTGDESKGSAETSVKSVEKMPSKEEEGEDAGGKIDLAKLGEPLTKSEEKLISGDGESSCQSVEFETLSSYLLKAEEKAKEFTADEIGYRIFKKYLRQDLPGIGPAIEKEQVDKVNEFMVYWSQKQEGMVMPRNIRHWMCPPLDKVPIPEP